MKLPALARAVAFGCAGLFLWMAVIQFNDPDPLYWFTLYAAVAVVALAAALGRPMPRLALVALGGVVAGLLIAAPGFQEYVQSGDWASLGGEMRADKPYVESGREFIGLVIAGAALLVLRPRRSS